MNMEPQKILVEYRNKSYLQCRAKKSYFLAVSENDVTITKFSPTMPEKYPEEKQINCHSNPITIHNVAGSVLSVLTRFNQRDRMTVGGRRPQSVNPFLPAAGPARWFSPADT